MNREQGQASIIQEGIDAALCQVQTFAMREVVLLKKAQSGTISNP